MKELAGDEARQLALDAIARAPRETFTNYFGQPLPASGVASAADDASLVITARELDFRRLYFVTRDPAGLQRLLGEIGVPANTIVTHIHKAPETTVATALSAHFTPYATYQRMALRALPRQSRNASLAFATAEELDELHALLSTNFDRYTDHLPALDALRERIAREEVLVRRADGRICGTLVFAIENGVCNFNYLYNGCASPLDLVAMLQNFYALLAERGVRRAFLWADVRKSGIIRMHARFGWKADGLVADYFLRTA